MVSGSDVHGTPITVKADQLGVSPDDIVAKYHGEFLDTWDAMDIQWDLYTTTGTETHKRVAKPFGLTGARSSSSKRALAMMMTSSSILSLPAS